MTSKLIIYISYINQSISAFSWLQPNHFFFNNCKIVLRSLSGSELVTTRHENRWITFASDEMELSAYLVLGPDSRASIKLFSICTCAMDLILQINKAHEKRWITFAMAEMESMAYLYQLQTLEVAENYLVSVFVPSWLNSTSKQSSFWINIDIFIPTILAEWIIITSLTKPK